MNLVLDIRILAFLLLAIGLLEVLPIAVALASGEPLAPFVLSAAAAIVFAGPLILLTRSTSRRMRPRDGFLVVSLAWFAASIAGAMPYWLSGSLGVIDALFESASGFTTTGSTVVVDIEGLSRGLLFWRSLTQWVGGMGIIVLVVAVLPVLGIGGMQLFQAEVPGPVAGKLTPRIADTARRLYLVYAGLTGLAVVGFWLAGMPAFDALCHALTAPSTGGFSPRAASIGAYQSAAVEWVAIVVMFLGGTNFVIHYRALQGVFRPIARDEELRLYAGACLALAAVVAVSLWWSGAEESPLRAALFQVVSLLTTTGFASADYERWPPFAQFVMLFLLTPGGMAGSTAGGLKLMRVWIGIRSFGRVIHLLPHRHGLRMLHFGGKPVTESVLNGILTFFVAYFTLAALAAAVVASAGYGLDTAVSAALTSVGNVGPGAGEVGPADHFGHFPGHVKLVLAFCMIAGRLEVFTLLALFVPGFWRR